MSSSINKIILGFAGATILATAASAGGYSRGSANLDPLLSSERFELSTSIVVTSPDRGYATINGVAADKTPTAIGTGAFLGVNPSEAKADFAETYQTYSGTAAVGFHESFRCAGSVSQPFGANADYGYSQILNKIGTTTSTELSSVELAATCAASLQAGPGRLHLIGGLYYQSVSYEEARGFGFGSALGGGDVKLEDDGVGYRVGVAYTVPEIAMKASLIYRSEIDHRAEGVTRNPALTGLGFLSNEVASFANVTTPQSVKLSLQSGVAPGWLVFGSVEWVDHSVIQQVQVFAKAGEHALAPTAEIALNGVTIEGYFRDGWTVTGGVGHQLTEKLALQSSLTWDRGVSTKTAARTFGGEEYLASSFSDTWTLAAGGRYALNEKASISGGLAYSYLTEIDYRNQAGTEIGFGNDHAISGALSFNVKF